MSRPNHWHVSRRPEHHALFHPAGSENREVRHVDLRVSGIRQSRISLHTPVCALLTCCRAVASAPKLTTLVRPGSEADNRHELPVEFPEPIWSKLFDSLQCSRGVCQEPLDINALTSRRERCQVARASGQHVHRPVVVPMAKMVESDANLQDALIEVTYLARFSPPQQFQCFVLLEVLAAVELHDPF